MTWTCCGTARCPRCSAASGRRPRWARTCAAIPGETSPSWRRRAGSSWSRWPGRRRCCPARARWRSSTSTRCRSGSTGTRSRAPGSGTRRSRARSLLVRGLNALAAVVSTPLSAPVIAATRLRGGNAASARGAASLAARPSAPRGTCGCTGTIIVRLDSAFYNAAVTGAIRRAGARFSVTVPVNASIRAAIAAIPEDAWTPIRYPRAIWDDQLGAWISDAEVAEVAVHGVRVEERPGGHRPADRPPGPRPEQAGGRRAGRAVPRLAATTRSSPTPRSSWSRPRGSTATTPSWSRSSPTSPAAPWLTCRPGSSPRTRPGCRSRPWRTTCSAPPAPWPACRFAKARAATIRRDLIAVAARTARHGRGHLTLHLPEGWHREHEWLNLLARRLRAARRSGLTSPDPVRTPTAATATPNPGPEPRNPGQAAEQASGKTPVPGFTSENSSCRNQAGNELPESAGGSRLSASALMYDARRRWEAGRVRVRAPSLVPWQRAARCGPVLHGRGFARRGILSR